MIQKDVTVRRTIQNTLEMDAEIFEALTSQDVGFHLIPLPKSSVEKAEKVERTNHYQPYNSGKGESSGKGKAKTRVRKASSTSCQSHFKVATT